MRAGPSHRVVAPLGRLRIEEAEPEAALPQILHLRALALARRISLSPDIHAWSDPLDMQSSHWCVFHDAALVATARLCVLTTTDGLPGIPRDAGTPPIALMSHCVVDPRFHERDLDRMLDSARIERARQMRIATLLARPESMRRVRMLAALGFTTIARDRRPQVRGGVLVLDLAAGPVKAIGRDRPRG